MTRKHSCGRIQGPVAPAKVRTHPKAMAGVFTYVGPTLDLPSDLGFAPHLEARVPSATPLKRRSKR
jgi:hypothetical protein